MAVFFIDSSRITPYDYYVIKSHKSSSSSSSSSLPSPSPKVRTTRPSPRRAETVSVSSHVGTHRDGERHTYDHHNHLNQAFVKNETGRTLPADEVRGILNSSSVALKSRHGALLTIVKRYGGGYAVIKA